MSGPSSPSAPSGPTQTTVQNTNIPDYAQPYVSNMLNATQSQLFTLSQPGQYDANGNPSQNGGYDAQGNAQPGGQITGFQPYTPYSNDPTKYVAGFSPLQQQAQSAAANLQTPGQYGAATNLAGRAGMGALGTVGSAGAYGGMGAQAGQQAGQLSNMFGGMGAQAGQQYAGQSSMFGGLGAMQGQQGANIGASLGQMSTNPGAVGAYMNPYIQNALAPAQQLLNQQYGMQNAAQQGAATQAGAFGGSRNALANSLTQQNQMLAQNQLVGNAYQNAYQNAQQQMNTANQAALAGNQQALSGYGMGLQGAGQAGAQAMQGYGMGLQGAQQAGQLGIQGAQAGLAGVGAQQAGYGLANTAAGNLANIGGQQLAAQQGIIGTQATQGAAQQAQQQQIINQAIQNYATAQQYPLLQLGTMSNMLRGLPMQASTTSIYQAQPTATQQAIGLGGTAAALGAAFGGGNVGKKEGGIIAMRKGGKVPGFKYGAVINDEQLQSDARQLGAAQGQPGQPSPLQQRINDPQVNDNERMIFKGVQADQNRLRQNPGAAQALMQAAQPPQPQQLDPRMMDQARLSGLGAAGGPAFNSQGFAGGGIIAFADEGLVPEPKVPANPTTPEEFAAARDAMMAKRGVTTGPTDAEKAYAEQLQTRGSDASRNRELALAIAQGFAKVGTTPAPGGLMQALNMGAQTAIPGIAKAYEAQESAKDASAKAASDLSEAQRKFAAGDVDEAWKDYDSYQKNKSAEKVAQIHASVAGQQANAEKGYVQQLLQQGYSLPDALQIVKGAGRAESVESANAKILLKDINDQIFNLDPKKDAAKIAELEKQRAAIVTNLQKGPAAGGPQPAPAPDASGIVDVPGKGKFKQLPNGNYVQVG